MAGLSQPLNDILTRLSGIGVTNGDLNPANLYSRVWNNQLRDIKAKDGARLYIFPMPAAFVEIMTPVSFSIIGLGLRSADLGIRIHLITNFTNEDGTFEQDLLVYAIRDLIIGTTSGLSQFCPTSCGPLNCVSEEQDNDHDNVNHYIMDFVTNFTDSTGSVWDPAAGNFNDTPNPNLDSTTDYIDPIPEPSNETNPEFILPVNNF